MVKIYFLLLTLSNIPFLTNGQTKQKEGLINFKSIIDPEGWKRYTWFSDSLQIFEVYKSYSVSYNDSIISQGVEVYHYSILDLTSMRGQDYLTFTDTATPVTNYTLSESESISWSSHARSQPYDKYIDSLKQLGDTIIENTKYKRVYFDILENRMHQRITYYLTHPKHENIFHMSSNVEKKFPGYNVTLIQYTDVLSGFSGFNRIEFIRDTLTTAERLIFKKWKENLNTCSIPTTSRNEAQKHLAEITYKEPNF